MVIKKHDFVELDYTGKVKDSGDIFDTTNADVAKSAQIFNPKSKYVPVVICIGENHILKSIDEFLVGKNLGKHFIELSADKAFGKKDAELIKMIPTNKFTEQGIKPVPNLRMNIDGYIGLVRSVTGGRTVVDFNHPLAGRDVSYELDVKGIVTDKKRQVEALLYILLNVRLPVEVKDNKAVVEFPSELPEQLKVELVKKISELTGMNIEFLIKGAKLPDNKPQTSNSKPSKSANSNPQTKLQ